MSATAGLHKKTCAILAKQLTADEQVITVLEGRAKQALVVTNQRLLLIKPGFMAGATLGANVTSFAFATVNGINAHVSMGGGVIEIVSSGHQAFRQTGGGHDFNKASYELPNCLPCDRNVAQSSVIAELRTYVQRSASAGH